jgi:F-type H+-transporting ATPase subunit delta
MTSSAVVNRYASALVDIVVSQRAGIDPARAVEQLRAFDSAVNSAPDLRTVLASPSVSAARKRQVIGRIADALGLERIIRNFLLVLSDRGRIAALPELLEAFDILLDERLGLVRAEIATALEATPPQRDELTSELEKVAGSRVRMRFVVDPDLIGGVTARLGSKVYDGSVRGQLARMQRRLASAG